VPVLLDTTRFKTKQSTLSAKGPAQIASFNATAQPCRLPDQSESANLSYVRKNELNMGQYKQSADGVYFLFYKRLRLGLILSGNAVPKRGNSINSSPPSVLKKRKGGGGPRSGSEGAYQPIQRPQTYPLCPRYAHASPPEEGRKTTPSLPSS